MDRATRTVATALLLCLAFAGGRAEGCTPSTSDPEVDIDTGGSRHYIDNDLCQPGCIFSIWSYEESNGIPGLQRGDEVKDDTCGGMIESDTLSPY